MSTSVKGFLRHTVGQLVHDAVVMIVDGSHPFNEIRAATDNQGIFTCPTLPCPRNTACT